MVGRTLLIGRRATESAVEFFRRRERCILAAIRRHARGLRSELHHYRVFSFTGHIARLSPATHMSAQVLAWRSDRWWTLYKSSCRLGPVGKKGGGRQTGEPQASWRRRSETLSTCCNARSRAGRCS